MKRKARHPFLNPAILLSSAWVVFIVLAFSNAAPGFYSLVFGAYAALLWAVVWSIRAVRHPPNEASRAGHTYLDHGGDGLKSSPTELLQLLPIAEEEAVSIDHASCPQMRIATVCK